MEVYALDILLTMLDDEKEGETKGWQSFFRKKDTAFTILPNQLSVFKTEYLCHFIQMITHSFKHNSICDIPQIEWDSWYSLLKV